MYLINGKSFTKESSFNLAKARNIMHKYPLTEPCLEKDQMTNIEIKGYSSLFMG